MNLKLCNTLLIAMAGLLLGPAMVSAQEPALSKTYSSCMDASGGVTSAMLDCADKELKRQDARLNKAYQELAKAQTPKRRDELKAVQRLWIQFRDANCSFYEDPDRGTSAAIAASGCVLAATAVRAAELESLKD
ncbi:MAG: lysozyme inhibitor LprI family protein [Beijerinckiaceae bacterium]|nr:lysozyme inhibitor LprI family protein [Beijerinckiaceae bacterium]